MNPIESTESSDFWNFNSKKKDNIDIKDNKDDIDIKDNKDNIDIKDDIDIKDNKDNTDNTDNKDNKDNTDNTDNKDITDKSIINIKDKTYILLMLKTFFNNFLSGIINITKSLKNGAGFDTIIKGENNLFYIGIILILFSILLIPLL